MPPTFSKHHRVRCWNSILTGFVRDMVFFEDGSLFAVSDSRGVLVILDILKGAPIHLLQLPPLLQISALSWCSPTRLVVGDTDGGVVFLDVSMPEVRTSLSRREPRFNFSLRQDVLSIHGFLNACPQLSHVSSGTGIVITSRRLRQRSGDL